MRLLGFLSIAALFLAPAAFAMALDGRALTVTTGETGPAPAAVSLPWDGPAPSGRVEVLHPESGAAFPATVHGGKITFLADGLEPNAAHRLVVRAHPENNPPKVRVTLDEDAGAATVHVRGEHFTTYNFHDDTRIPHLWPVHAEGGVAITRNYPMGTDDPESTDHRHHKSMWTAFGDVNGYDHWHRLPIVTESVEVGSGDAYGWIRAENLWPDADGEPLLRESREYRFLDGPASARVIDQTVTFTAAREVVFGDDKEGFFAFRIRPEIQGNRAGVLTNALGEQGERNVYGTPTEWMDYSGPIEGVGHRGVALFSHPGNFRLPAWHVRDYGLVGGNFFALSDVAKLDEDGSYTLAEGDTLTLRARYFVHSGDVEEARVAERYADYATPPQAEWAADDGE